jgi:hypothetical protein
MGNGQEISPLCEKAKLRDTGTVTGCSPGSAVFQLIEAKRKEREDRTHT